MWDDVVRVKSSLFFSFLIFLSLFSRARWSRETAAKDCNVGKSLDAIANLLEIGET